MVSGLNVCFISCYCCCWATDKAGTPLTCESNRAKKKQEKENRRNSQKYKAGERGKQMFVMRKRRKKGEEETDGERLKTCFTSVRNSLKTKEDENKC